MCTNANNTYAARLLAAIDLMEFGISLMRQNIVRRHPDASANFIDSELQRWLIEQPSQYAVSEVIDTNK